MENKSKTIIIAECGVNHNGDINLAKEMIDVASDAKADYVKFQTFKTELLSTADAPMSDYQVRNLGKVDSQFNMLKKLEFSAEQFHILKDYCDSRKIPFLSTPFDFESLDLLINLDVDMIKISSGDLTNGPLLFKAAKSQKKIIISTGMATFEEIKKALSVLAWGYFYPNQEPINFSSMMNFFATKEAQSIINAKVYILQCTSEYPTPSNLVNLNTLKTLKSQFNASVGFSDHTLGYHIAIAAVAMGAAIIEKHFTLNRDFVGPDHKASLMPKELKEMITQIREVENALGDGIKQPVGNEIETARLVRKALYANNNITKDQRISPGDIQVLRPYNGNLEPNAYWDIVNTPAKKDYRKGDPL